MSTPPAVKPTEDMPQSLIDADLEAWREARDKNRLVQYHECQKCFKDLECDEPMWFESGDCHCASLYAQDPDHDGCEHEI